MNGSACYLPRGEGRTAHVPVQVVSLCIGPPVAMTPAQQVAARLSGFSIRVAAGGRRDLLKTCGVCPC